MFLSEEHTTHFLPNNLNPRGGRSVTAMLSLPCLLLAVLASQVAGGRYEPGDRQMAGGRYEPGDRVVEVNVRYAKEGMEEEFQLARKEITDAVR